MNSIDRQQPEANYADLLGADAIAKIKEIVKEAKSCFFCTVEACGSVNARPMSPRSVDDEGNLWFLSAIDSHKNHEIANDSSVTLYFQASSHSGFMQLTGNASLSRDRVRIKELWNPTLATWFTEGVDDQRITVIKVRPVEGYYWDTKHGEFVAGIKIMIGAMMGKTLDGSVQGAILPRG